MSLAGVLKPKIDSSHLSRIVNAEGILVEAEKREDEQQKVKYEEIISILIGAGYYRAKIKGISEFDKVVGGMTWCIVVCNIDLDVDLLFQENSTIGQKIALTEKIVAALKKMKCPYMIEPHQIQGLDFIHIFPVVQWLVKKSLESREERGDYLRQYAVHRFNQRYTFPGERPNLNFIKRALPHITALQNKYRVQRKYRRVEGCRSPSDPLSRVQSTLFEYGHAPLSQKEESDGDEAKHVEAVDEVKLKQMIKTMTSATDEIKLAPQAVTNIVSLKSDEIVVAAKTYDSLIADSEVGEKAELKKLLDKEKLLNNKCSALEEKLKEGIEKLNELRAKTKLSEESESKLSDHERKILFQLEEKLLLIESLTSQEVEFKEFCKAEKSRLEAMIRETEEELDAVERGEEGGGEMRRRTSQEELACLEGQLSQARISLAKLSRTEAKLQRTIDQVPSRPELNQYQRRFIELYNQVSAKYKETKQYYTLYNSMSDQHEYLNKELKLLDSILEGYNAALHSSHAKEEFINKFETLVDGIKQNKAKVEMKRNEEREVKDRLRSQLSGLIEQQRLYASLLKQFREECELNESLLSRLKTQGSPGYHQPHQPTHK